MRDILTLAAALALLAGAAHAQFQPIQPVPGIPGIPPIAGPRPTPAFKPYELPMPSADPFSPAGQAARERRAEAAEQARENGVFSPASEAKRERAQAKRNRGLNPF